MEDTKTIKNLFSVDVESVISDTADEKVGEAGTKYSYNMNTSFPELAYSIAGFLKTIDADPDIKQALNVEAGTVGDVFINLIKLYYDQPDE